MDDYSISDTLLGFILGAGDGGDYGLVTNERSCLLLDEVMEGKPLTSKSRLLALPSELLADIVDLLRNDKPSLADLALVNTDCRQLARSAQFADVRFVYSFACCGLLAKLEQECAEREAGRPGLSIGACIRRVTLETAYGWVAYRHPELYEANRAENLGKFTPEERAMLDQEPTKQYVSYRNSIAKMIRHGMPNIEALNWLDKFAVDRDVWSAITGTQLRSLRFNRLALDKSCREVDIAPGSMSLHTLDLECREAVRSINPGGGRGVAAGLNDNRAYASMVSKILRGCAPTLRTLHLEPYGFMFKAQVPLMDGVHVEFPQLRVLHLGSGLPQDAVDALLQSPVKHIDVVSPRWKEYGYQHMPNLESANIGGMRSGEDFDSAHKFLEQHHYIRKLNIWPPVRPSGLDQQIIPLLSSGSFAALTSLALSWDDPAHTESSERSDQINVEEASLTAIGRIESLEQLSLSVGFNMGWRFKWAIDHRVVRRCLKPLKNLRRFAINRDGYRNWEYDSVQRYYEAKRTRLYEGHYGMCGPMEDMFDLRLRPELDDYLFEPESESFTQIDKRYTEEDLEFFVNRTGRQWEDGIEEEQDGDQDGEAPITGWDRRYANGVVDRYLRLDREHWFEIIHRNRMLKQAELYAKVLPRLEWILSGQWPMQIKRVGDGATATPLTKERDLCWPYVRRMFGAVEDYLGVRM